MRDRLFPGSAVRRQICAGARRVVVAGSVAFVMIAATPLWAQQGAPAAQQQEKIGDTDADRGQLGNTEPSMTPMPTAVERLPGYR